MEINEIASKPFVVVLGCGKSINNLTPKQLNLIERAQSKIAINKFGAFYELAKIIPTHIYFHDDYTTSAILFLKHIFIKFRKEDLKNITFIISKRYKGYLFKNKVSFKMKLLRRAAVSTFKRYLIKAGRLIIKPIDVSVFNEYKNFLGNEIENKDDIRISLIQKKSKIHYVEIQPWKTRGNFWATSINQKLYHYRGGLTSVLNYVSIVFPNHVILLAGVDFNSYGYFFSDDLLKEFPFETNDDWTTDLSREKEKHFSIIDHEGTKIDDEFPFVVNQLQKTGNKMYSLNDKSYLVEKGFVEFLEV